MESPLNKTILREQYKLIRQQLPKNRQLIAREALISELYPSLKSFSCILSFSSFHGEIDLWPLNQLLASEGRLCLPRMDNHQIHAYGVSDIENQLLKSDHGPLEPNPQFCQPIAKEKLDCILVPGLCFDQDNNRLGYGLGHFDRFLKGILTIPMYGIGFKEQLISKLPVESHDIRLTKVYLF